jgi:membrane protease YdiL (CAAX protease family)
LAGTGIILFTNNAEIHFFGGKFNYLFSSFIVIILLAITEEIVFRGYILKNLTTFCGKNTAVLIGALLFATFHLLNPNISLLSFLNIFLAGLLLGFLYVKTINLWLPISFHIFWNYIQSLLGYSVSGEEMPSIFTLEYANSNLINGGEFGFEGSLVCSILLIIAILVIFRNKLTRILFWRA